MLARISSLLFVSTVGLVVGCAVPQEEDTATPSEAAITKDAATGIQVRLCRGDTFKSSEKPECGKDNFGKDTSIPNPLSQAETVIIVDATSAPGILLTHAKAGAGGNSDLDFASAPGKLGLKWGRIRGYLAATDKVVTVSFKKNGGAVTSVDIPLSNQPFPAVCGGKGGWFCDGDNLVECSGYGQLVSSYDCTRSKRPGNVSMHCSKNPDPTADECK